jgi:hypothetical protein
VSAAPAVQAEPPPRLQRVTPRSFVCSRHELDRLAAWLAGRAWREYRGKGAHEFVRLWRADALIILYRSGSIVAGGPNASAALAELNALIGVARLGAHWGVPSTPITAFSAARAAGLHALIGVEGTPQ